MSKLNQIQNRLLELDGGAFQKLADSYLYKKGYEAITSRGSVSGADKVRKGTPDSFFLLPNGKYVFAEHTTKLKGKGLFKKLEGDLNKCFDEEKTGIPTSRVEKALLCHTSKLDLKEESALAEICQRHGVDLETFGIDRISQDLKEKYRGLARDFLGVEVDTGQIVPPDEFVAQYNKNKLATRLDTAFHFREKELEQILEVLGGANLVLVSGRAGIGKTRLALECCRRFQEAHAETQVRCILSRGRDLFEDLRVDFSEPGHFLVFVDDANRVSRFEYVVELLQLQRADQRIKVIATVRDYALERIQKAARPHGGAIEVEVGQLEDKEIRQLVENEHGIHDHLYLERIVDIAQGNPRLAIMAAEVALQEETLASIHDVTGLYDRYFESIREELDDLGDESVLQAAGIVAFFRVVDRSNEDAMQAIERAFDLSLTAFWESVRRLHEMEIFDLYENEVVRPSDQVLSTYLFYLAFFRRRVLDFSVLLESFFPRLRSRLVDVVEPVINTFGFESIQQQLLPHVQRTWEARRVAGDHDGLLQLADVFGFVRPTDTLLYLREQIEALEVNPVEPDDLRFEPSSSGHSPSILSVLASMHWGEDSLLEIGLGLLYDYSAKRAGNLPEVLHLLTVRFGFHHTSHLLEYRQQRKVVETLLIRMREGRDEFFSRMFLAVAKSYLRTDFESRTRKGQSVAFRSFSTALSPELSLLRRTIWSRVFSLFEIPTLRTEVLGLIRDYSTSGHVSVNEIAAQDSEEAVHFLGSKLEPDNYIHCCVVQEYLAFLREHQVSAPSELEDLFRSETYALAVLLKRQWPDEADPELAFAEYERRRQGRLAERFKDSTLAEYLLFIERCAEILATPSRDTGEPYEIRGSIGMVLNALSQRDPCLYSEVLGRYLEAGDSLDLPPQALAHNLVEACGPRQSYDILNSRAYPRKRSWLFSYFQALQPEAITEEHLERVYTLYREAERADLPFHLDFLLNYRAVDTEVVANVTEIVLEKAKSAPDYATAISMLFNPYSESNKILIDLFSARVDLLGQAYLANLRGGQFRDSDGQDLGRVLDLDPGFIVTYVDELRAIRRDNSSWHDPIRTHSGLWQRDNYEQLMALVVGRIVEQESEKSMFAPSLLERLFDTKARRSASPEVRQRQDHFLRKLIGDRHDDAFFMGLLFSVIARFSPERSRPLVAHFLENNKSLKAFQELPLTPRTLSSSGSFASVCQRQAYYFESLLPLFKGVDLLQHRKVMERKIQDLRAQIEVERKNDFMRD